jgi:hypothetical protein
VSFPGAEAGLARTHQLFSQRSSTVCSNGFGSFRAGRELIPVAYPTTSIVTQSLPEIYLFEIQPMLCHIP